MTKNIWEAIKKLEPGNQLSESELYDWATRQANRSEAYKKGELPPTSEGEPAKKQSMLQRIRQAYHERSNLSPAEIEATLKVFENRLEDPGLLDNFEYFDIPSSDFMLNFYLTLWNLNVAEVMDYCHNFGKDLKGVKREIPSKDVWFQMSRFEAMNVDARKKAESTVEFILNNNITCATSFGGGNIPERFYGLPSDMQLTIFDDGKVSPLEELFPEGIEMEKLIYIRERLSSALRHPELFGTQELVWMTGVAMYLKLEEMVGAVLCGSVLLMAGGFMRFDYLIWSESMRRVIASQGWPYDPENPMVIYRTADEAIKQACDMIKLVNAKLESQNYQMFLLDPEITLVEPWGPTSVRFTVQKVPK